jgi:hypothetical protein
MSLRRRWASLMSLRFCVASLALGFLMSLRFCVAPLALRDVPPAGRKCSLWQLTQRLSLVPVCGTRERTGLTCVAPTALWARHAWESSMMGVLFINIVGRADLGGLIKYRKD